MADSAQPKEPTEAAEKPSTSGARLAAKRAAKAARKASERGTVPVGTEKVQESIGKVDNWMASNGQVLWVGLAVIVIMGVGFAYYTQAQAAEGAEAAGLLGDGAGAMLAPIVAQGEEPPDSLDESYPSNTARAEAALKHFTALQKKHSGSGATGWAMLGEGGALLELGKYDEANKVLAKAEKQATDGFTRWRAIEGQGFALEALDKYDEAALRFEAAGNVAPRYKVAGDYHLARMLVLSGKKERAVEILKALVEAQGNKKPEEQSEFESIVGSAELLLAELGHKVESKLRADIPTTPIVQPGTPPPVGAPGGSQIDPSVLENLKKQLEAQGVNLEQLDINNADGKATLKVKQSDEPAPQGAPEPEAAVEPEPTPAVAPKAKATPAPKAEPAPKAKAEPKAEPAPEAKAEPSAAPKGAPDAPAPQPAPQAAPEPAPEPVEATE